jgi:NTP pyrophosphatase (non-canonical NTP hydrolase)
MKIKEFQELMYALYYHRDNKRGINKTFMWLVEEVGELSRALKQEKLDKKNISQEIADIIAWVCSLSNLLNIDLEKALLNKYPNRCPKCGHNPCQCG